MGGRKYGVPDIRSRRAALRVFLQSTAVPGERGVEGEKAIRGMEALAAARAVEGGIVTWLEPFLLCLKGGATTAGAGGVGIEDLEPGVGEVVRVIELGSTQVLQTVGGEEDARSVLFDHLVALYFLGHLQGILEASATPALDTQPQA